MEKLQNQNRIKIFSLFCFIIVTLIVCIPILHKGLPLADDIHFHLSRIHNLAVGLKAGQFPVKIHPAFFNGYGYASGLCYPDIFLYIPAIFTLLGLSLELSYKLFVVLIIIATYATSYYAGVQIAKNRFSGIVCAVIYSLYFYHFTNLYKRSALGEMLACIFIPLAVLGLYNLFYHKLSRPVFLIVGYVGLFYSNTISFYCMSLLAVVLFLCYLPLFFKDKKLFLKLLGVVGIALLLVAVFLLPLLEQIAHQALNVFYRKIDNHFVPKSSPWFYLFSLGTYDYLPQYNGYGYYMGFLPLLFSLFFFFPQVRALPKEEKKPIRFFLFTGLGILLVAGPLFPWPYMQWLLKNIQFSWRLYSIAPFFLAVATSLCLPRIFTTEKSKKIVSLSLIGVFSLWALISYQIHPQKYMETPDLSKSEKSYYTGAAEWIPWGAQTHSCDNLLTLSSGKTVAHKKNGTTVEVDIKDTGSTYADIPFLYYKGYSATIITETETLQLEVVKNEKGHVRVTLPQKAGKLTVSYKGTTVQKLSLFVTLGTLIGCVFYLRTQRQKNSKRKIG